MNENSMGSKCHAIFIYFVNERKRTIDHFNIKKEKIKCRRKKNFNINIIGVKNERDRFT